MRLWNKHIRIYVRSQTVLSLLWIQRMRDDIVYRSGVLNKFTEKAKSFLDDGWKEVRDQLQTDGHNYMTYYEHHDKEAEHVGYYLHGHDETSKRLFINPIILFTKPWLAAYYIVSTAPPSGDAENIDTLAHPDTFLNHLSTHYSNMYCRIVQTSTLVSLVTQMIDLLDKVTDFSGILKSIILDEMDEMTDKEIRDANETIEEIKDAVSQRVNTAIDGTDKLIRVALKYVFTVMIILTHIGIMKSGFMHRAVAITRGNRRANLTMDEEIVQLVKMYAADTDYYIRVGTYLIKKFPIIGDDLHFFVVETFWRNLMSMWTAHYWIALTTPMDRLRKHILESNENDIDLIRELEGDPYWSILPTKFDTLWDCGAYNSDQTQSMHTSGGLASATAQSESGHQSDD